MGDLAMARSLGTLVYRSYIERTGSATHRRREQNDVLSLVAMCIDHHLDDSAGGIQHGVRSIWDARDSVNMSYNCTRRV